MQRPRAVRRYRAAAARRRFSYFRVERCPLNEITCWIPLGRFVNLIVVGRMPGAKWIRSAFASDVHVAGSSLPCAVASSVPAASIAAHSEARHAVRSPAPQNFVLNGLLNWVPVSSRRSLSTKLIRPPV